MVKWSVSEPIYVPLHPFGTRLFDEASSQQKHVGEEKKKGKLFPELHYANVSSPSESSCASLRIERRGAETALFSLSCAAVQRGIELALLMSAAFVHF